MKTFLRHSWALFMLVVLLFWDLIVSVIEVSRNVLNPDRVKASSIIAIPIDLKNDYAIMMLANMVTLTPGTLSLHVSNDKTVLYVHVMDIHEDFVPLVKRGFESRVKRVFE